MTKKKTPATKVCTSCDKRKKIEQFYNSSYALDGKQCYCKKCSKEKALEHRHQNLERYQEREREYRLSHPEQVRAHHQEYYARPEIAKRQAAYQKKYSKVNADKKNETSKKWQAENDEYVKAKRKQYYIDNQEYFKEQSHIRWRKKHPEVKRKRKS